MRRGPQVLKLLGQRLSTTEVKRMLSHMDYDKNTVVDFVEFLYLMLKNVRACGVCCDGRRQRWRWI